MKQFNVTGMSCAACSARVEKAVSSVEGVTSCAVSLLTNSMGVEGTASDEAIIKAVTEAGYGASPEKENDSVNKADELKDRETPKLIRRLIISVILLLPLMYVSMGHMMWGFPLPAFLHGSYLARGVFQMILSAAVLIVNRRFFVNGLRGVVHSSANMDTLVAMGSGISFVYSVYLLFFKGEETGLYFESAAMILTLITVGKTLEAYSKGRTTDALKSLMTLAPETATILIDGKETSVPVGEVKKDDVFIVRAGESVPVDGVVTEGAAAVDESALTGESIPVDKTAGDTVSAATVSCSGYIKCRATRVGKDTTLSQIIKMVSDAAATKAPIAKIADRVSGVFVPVVIGFAVITVIVWLIAGREFGYALSRGITVLVISCPCSLGLATPVAIMVGNGVGAKNGILFKTSASLEESGRIQIVALDKTGTVTDGRPVVTDVIPYGETGETELLECAYSLEKKSSHPLAKAVTDYAEERNCSFSETEDFRNSEGNGICAEYKGKESYAGNYRFISSKIALPAEVPEFLDGLAAQGKTPMLFACGGEFLGIIAVADTVRDDSAQAVRELHDMGIKTVILTGDNSRTAQAIAKQTGVDLVVSDLLPGDKSEVIRDLARKGKTAMVGDGINDAPALTGADTGIAVGAGTDVAIDAADVVIMNSRLTDVSAAIRLSRAVLRNIHENLFWAFIYNIIGIPLAAGVFIPLFGWELNSMFGAAAMSLSSFCVVSNALRLNLFNIHSTKRDKIKNTVADFPAVYEIKHKKDDEKMTKTILVEGMMCPHCEAHVKEALEKIDGVTQAAASHVEGKVTVTLSKDVDDGVLAAAIESAGYKVK